MLKRQEEARLEGIEFGERKSILKVARMMLSNGPESAMVMQMTGLIARELAHIQP